jgi:hypothetical protein
LLHKAKGLQELVDVDVAILVEIDAPCKVTDTVIRDVNVHMRAEQIPSLSELIQRDEPLSEGKGHFMSLSSLQCPLSLTFVQGHLLPTVRHRGPMTTIYYKLSG